MAEGWFRAPKSTVASQKGAARPRLKESWVAGVKIKGNSPSMLEIERSKKRDRKMATHLCPVRLRGERSWVKLATA